MVYVRRMALHFVPGPDLIIQFELRVKLTNGTDLVWSHFPGGGTLSTIHKSDGWSADAVSSNRILKQKSLNVLATRSVSLAVLGAALRFSRYLVRACRNLKRLRFGWKVWKGNCFSIS